MASFGENLRRERELRGITLQELADRTKVNIRHIQALERNQFDRLPGGIFNRGFVRSIARYMKLDEALWVGEYARAAGEEPEILAMYAKETPKAAAASPRRGVWSYVALVVVFAVGAYVVHDLRMRRAAEAAALLPVASPSSAPATPVVSPPAPATATPAVSMPAAPEGFTPAPAAPAPAVETVAPSASDAGGGLKLQVDVVEEAWVRVVVDEQVRFEGRVRPGQPKRFRAGSRFEVSTRNASAVVLTLNGETLPPLGQPGEEKTVVLTAQDLKPATQ
ncbi:MAG TPA: helix-turn-helix domain-containing protein [Candidatus Xenobia bacterium]|nr:helix-turn-helix domain-containing protein [Candidatus Xenobia bacterium]